ncbi:hypothetical protein [Phenylobacterium sp.]|uniref:hypothetical protein n=1 Tax=Phenylobacterium sp. TaxID=1871053 RepID=UPI0035B17128
MLPMFLRYDIRQDRTGWTVFDQWTGETVSLACVLQFGLSHGDAVELADMLNRRSARTAILQ